MYSVFMVCVTFYTVINDVMCVSVFATNGSMLTCLHSGDNIHYHLNSI